VTTSDRVRSWQLSRANEERGFALVAAVFVLAIIGALIASSFFAGRLEQQSGQSSFFAAQAREAAEAGLTESIAGASAAALEGLAVGGVPLEIGNIVIGNGVTARSQVSRLTSRLFLIRADGQRQSADGTVLARRSLGLLVQLVTSATEESGSSVAVTPLAERGWVHLF
jgi:hypothetical protein